MYVPFDHLLDKPAGVKGVLSNCTKKPDPSRTICDHDKRKRRRTETLQRRRWSGQRRCMQEILQSVSLERVRTGFIRVQRQYTVGMDPGSIVSAQETVQRLHHLPALCAPLRKQKQHRGRSVFRVDAWPRITRSGVWQDVNRRQRLSQQRILCACSFYLCPVVDLFCRHLRQCRIERGSRLLGLVLPARILLQIGQLQSLIVESGRSDASTDGRPVGC